MAQKTESLPTAQLVSRDWIHKGADLQISIDRIGLPNQQQVDLEIIHHPGAAAVIPFLSATEILLIRQYRWAVSDWIYEIPAGKQKPNESAQECALRELQEEVGYTASELRSLGTIWTVPGFSNEKIHLFAAYHLKPCEQHLDQDEQIQVVPVTLAQAIDWIQRGTLQDAKSICALLKAFTQPGLQSSYQDR